MCAKHPGQLQQYDMAGVGLVCPRCWEVAEMEAAKSLAALVQRVDGNTLQKRIWSVALTVYQHNKEQDETTCHSGREADTLRTDSGRTEVLCP